MGVNRVCPLWDNNERKSGDREWGGVDANGASLLVQRSLLVNSRHPDPRRVLGRYRAAVRGPESRDPGDRGMESFLRVLGGLLFQNTLWTPQMLVLG